MSYFLIGFLAGGLIIGTVVYLFQKTRLSDIQSMQATFDQLSQQSLQKTQDQFFQLANERFKGQSEQHNQGLDHKKALIDQTLVTVKKEIEQATWLADH